MSLLIKNGNVVFSDCVKKCDIFIEGSRIKKIAEVLDMDADEIIDAQNKTVMAGFIDMHCHLREPGFEYKEDIDSGGAAALRGGFTTVACMPNTNPVIDNAALVKFILTRSAESDKVKILPIGAATKGQQGAELAEMGKMKEAGIKAVSDDGNPVESAYMMRNVLRYAKSHDLLVISHCEDKTLSAGGVVNEGFNSTISGLKGIPKCAEEVMVARDVLIAENFKTRLHIAHVSTKNSIEIIRQAKKRGVMVTAETCPHYICATDEEISSYNTNAKINPPLREEEDIEAIIQGLKDGTIDAIATDHAPHSEEEKQREFNLAPFGTVGFETAFSICYTYLVEEGVMGLPQLSKLMSANPSRILGIPGGVIAENETADLVIADLNASYQIDTRLFASKSRNCVFDGWHVKGKVLYTIVDGEIKERV